MAVNGRYKYDNWVTSDHQQYEWHIAYHGVRADSNLHGIISNVDKKGKSYFYH